MKTLPMLVAVSSVLALTACETTNFQDVTERAIATKEIATATLNAICSRPDNDVVRTDIRKALSKVSDVDSRKICVQGLDSYLTAVVAGRFSGGKVPAVSVPVEPRVE
jgi:hypothetical protein